MTGAQQLTVWLFGLFCVASAACSIARTLAAARTECAKAEVEQARQHARAHVAVQRMLIEAQYGCPVYVPADWQEEDR